MMSSKTLLLVWSCCVFIAEASYEKEKYSIGIFAAYATIAGHREECMGQCFGRNNDFCRTGSSSSDEHSECRISSKFSIRQYTEYYGSKTHLCSSGCAKYDDYYANWCVTESTWYKCIKQGAIALTRKPASNDNRYPCKAECDADKKWCYIYPFSYKSCKPNKVAYVPKLLTSYSTRCETSCVASDDSKTAFHCYDERGNYAPCYPGPDASHVIQSFHSYAMKRLSKFNDTDSLVPCPLVHRRKRNDDYYDVTLDEIDTLELESIFDGINTVEQMADLIATWYPTEQVRQPSNEYPHPTSDPVVSYSVRVVHDVFQNPQVILPMAVRAVYSTRTGHRNARQPYDEVNFANQNPLEGDDHGHIIQHSLGGSEEAHNIVPQPFSLNRGGSWKRMENIMRRFLRNNPRGTINHTVVMLYNFAASYRPTVFAVQIRFYNHNRQLVNEYGSLLASPLDNIYENFYLLNRDPPC